MSQIILSERSENGIITITLNRPQAANALNKELLVQFNELLDTLANDSSIRCVIITGNGEKAFCAGADLKERKGLANHEVEKAVSQIRDTFTKLEALPQPVIAAMNGVAFGGGLELALACDLRIASASASFGLTETSLAIIPGAGGTQRLPRLIGVAKAKELIYTAARIDSAEAEKIGLISRAIEPSQLLQEAYLLANRIVQNGPVALKQAKKAIHHGMETDLQTALKVEEWCYAATIPTNDRLEGLQAFSEKRKPVYKGQ
ncbi:enoyl-CoA hydratase [Bacillus massiliigorillae]|uniref:enoyl-CoA hydratase n=1 Tax=Bacillus massiliigorillae TaxID=1243664 RepID=UPI0003A89FBA|nr:enoyl-CoA hydratase [Bacillus massiliigorillae]